MILSCEKRILDAFSIPSWIARQIALGSPIVMIYALLFFRLGFTYERF